MEIADEPLPAERVGPKIAAGRDSTIYAVGEDRVLRRAPDPSRSFVAEAEVMEHVGAAGYPVPVVHRVGPGEMVLERVRGRTMANDLEVHPWRLRSHARLLTDLHHRLHRIPAAEGAPSFPVAGDAMLHLDLHPENVILSPSGPVVIDWTNAAKGPPGADVALTWIIVATFEIDSSRLLRILATLFRGLMVRMFLAAAGKEEARKHLATVAEYRRNDRNIRPGERRALDRLVEKETGAS